MWRATQPTARLQGRRKREWEQRLLAACTTTYFLNYGRTSLMFAWQGRLWVTVGQQDVRWLQVRAWHDCSYIAWISLLGHGLTMKLIAHARVANHSSLAGRIAACLRGHFKCNLPLAQAQPRMIQHLSSYCCYTCCFICCNCCGDCCNCNCCCDYCCNCCMCNILQLLLLVSLL